MLLAAPLLLSLLLLAPPCARADLRMDINPPSSGSDPVPESFMGLSIEPLLRAPEWADSPEFVGLIKRLASYSTGPFIMRWGGSSQDTLTEVLGDDVWNALWFLHNETGCVYTVGLNLESMNVTLAKTQLTNALNILPAAAIYSIEVGNEPDRLENSFPDEFPTGYVTKGGWYADQQMFLDALAPIVLAKLGTVQVFTGPDIADISNWRTDYIKKWFTSRETGKYAKGVSCHWYATKSTYSTATLTTLLSETMSRVTATNGGRWAALATAFNKTFRFSETNSLSLGGKAGVSDTLGASIFIVDYAFNLIKAGVHGMNLHMGACSPYSAIMLPITCDNAGCVQYCTPPNASEARAPYYGMWMVQKALAGGAKHLHNYTSVALNLGKMKAYALTSENEEEVRIVLVAKGLAEETVSIYIRDNFDYAEMTVLEGTAGSQLLSAEVPNITLGAQQVGAFGNITGTFSPLLLETKWDGAGTTIEFNMPGFSAGLIVVKRVSMKM